jgi:hypothetical protein
MRYHARDNTWACDCGAAWPGPPLPARAPAHVEELDFPEAA